MMRSLSLRWLTPFALVVLMLPACSDSADEAADTTLAPTTTAAAAQSVIPPEVEQTLDEYIAAWEANDGDAFLATVTSDFLINEYWYIETGDASDGVKLSYIISDDDPANAARLGVEDGNWSVTRGDEVVVTGDGPWFVAFEEVWIDEPTVGTGIATYVVEMIDGQPRITNHYWVGLSELVGN